MPCAFTSGARDLAWCGAEHLQAGNRTRIWRDSFSNQPTTWLSGFVTVSLTVL